MIKFRKKKNKKFWEIINKKMIAKRRNNIPIMRVEKIHKTQQKTSPTMKELPIQLKIQFNFKMYQTWWQLANIAIMAVNQLMFSIKINTFKWWTPKTINIFKYNEIKNNLSKIKNKDLKMKYLYFRIKH